uniref:Uncharacterized protein n=1 Tax=Chromera velia CCMP2878 TaxID=1169474 RepID=A0A0G4IA08_9ALVE|eukprot:Cvel_12318.t1-p1 / transcript=Cvel_12318.t1 / gene=Cvel_12318 / organism=Chromera_velia_CCMP2878 / gene_product=hypothetical protein / transcript_product=hypothetical protein / location=Cvel_scaffold800:58089-59351(-) / protein_length=171 / sequence_SO=supercontig / SO=protein_coding / is_pseudo=false
MITHIRVWCWSSACSSSCFLHFSHVLTFSGLPVWSPGGESGDIWSCESMNVLRIAEWAPSNKERNRLVHAYNGNLLTLTKGGEEKRFTLPPQTDAGWKRFRQIVAASFRLDLQTLEISSAEGVVISFSDEMTEETTYNSSGTPGDRCLTALRQIQPPALDVSRTPAQAPFR